MAITECVDAGATVINLSSALPPASSMAQRNLEQALAYAAKRGTLIVAAAGNHGMIGSSTITQHQWVLPVVACDRRGRPTSQSNLGASIGRRGLSAPGYEITSLGVGGKLVSLGGTSAATPFVTGTIALLASEFPGATPAQIKLAITQGASPRRNAIVPPLLNAWAAYEAMVTSSRRSVNA
jgi:subtilisin family serine protease